VAGSSSHDELHRWRDGQVHTCKGRVLGWMDREIDTQTDRFFSPVMVLLIITIRITITITITMTINSNLHAYIFIYIYSRVCVGEGVTFLGCWVLVVCI
jgi:hypothetical protein